ncbi:glycosyltransferase family 2 protein [Vibrio cholerae]|nr:glycosyltransferase family 2 protein [Vibrio cholerae]
MNRIVYIFTNYNNSNFTVQAVESIQSQKRDGLSGIVIVDNASRDDSKEVLDRLSLKHQNVSVIYNSENLGYFKGLNKGIEFSLNKYGGDSLFVVGNNDLIFGEEFEVYLCTLPDYKLLKPVLCPNIITLDGEHQNPHVISRIGKIREIIYDIYHSNYYLAGMILKLAKLTSSFTDRKDEEQHHVEQEIYQGYGACYILTPTYFKHFNRLPEDSFLMYEEFFLAKQLSEKGLKCFYEPSLVIQHHCHASTGTLPGKLRWQLSKKAHKEYRKYVKIW